MNIIRLCVMVMILTMTGFAADTTLVQESSVALQVGDRDASAHQAIAQAEALGGWLLRWNEWNVTVRVPAANLQNYLHQLDSLGRKIDESYTSQDQGTEVESLRSSIDSRKKLLDSFFAMVKSSNSDQVQSIQREIVELISNIELDEGRLHAMEAKARDALVNISFHIENRNLPAPTGQSRFAWLNHLNLSEHRGFFQGAQ